MTVIHNDIHIMKGTANTVEKEILRRKNISISLTKHPCYQNTSRNENISKARKGHKNSEKHNINISLGLKGKYVGSDNHMFNTHLSIKTRKKISKRLLGNKYSLGYIHSDETKKQMRIRAIEYIEKTRGHMKPNIGKNEKKYLDELEKLFNTNIIRQFYIKQLGYMVDGYIEDLNIVIEIDEKPKDSNKEILRETAIKKQLNCDMIRIKDY